MGPPLAEPAPSLDDDVGAVVTDAPSFLRTATIEGVIWAESLLGDGGAECSATPTIDLHYQALGKACELNGYPRDGGVLECAEVEAKRAAFVFAALNTLRKRGVL